MTFVGFLLFLDPPKLGIQQTLADLAQLGIQLKIITGDNERVALHLAETIGLQVTGVLTGAELQALLMRRSGSALATRICSPMSTPIRRSALSGPA